MGWKQDQNARVHCWIGYHASSHGVNVWCSWWGIWGPPGNASFLHLFSHCGGTLAVSSVEVVSMCLVVPELSAQQIDDLARLRICDEPMRFPMNASRLVSWVRAVSPIHCWQPSIGCLPPFLDIRIPQGRQRWQGVRIPREKKQSWHFVIHGCHRDSLQNNTLYLASAFLG